MFEVGSTVEGVGWGGVGWGRVGWVGGRGGVGWDAHDAGPTTGDSACIDWTRVSEWILWGSYSRF